MQPMRRRLRKRRKRETAAMHDPFPEETLRDYTALLASAAPAPGGGSAAALCGALGAALASMSCAIGGGSADTPALDTLRLALLELVQRDSEGFDAVVQAWKIPKDEPLRPEMLDRAYAKAAETPLGLMELCCRLTEICERVAGECPRSVAADAACALIFARAAMKAAGVNVRANTIYIKDTALARRLDAEADALAERCERRADAAFTLACARMEK